MTPVMQTVFGFPHGNCFQACVASVFDLPIEEVPNFFKGVTADDTGWTQEQWDAVRAFAASRGFRAFWVDPETDPLYVKMLHACDAHYIAIGPSPGGDFGHCVVMHRGVYVHDPMGREVMLAGDPWLYIGFEPHTRETI